ncbi:MAG: hypothetical protein AB1483_11845 [Candidatus Zixiibacteriota bacterium]
MRGRGTFLLVCTLVGIMFLVQPVVAQNYWMYPGEGTSVSLEVFKPKFEDWEGVELLTSVWLLSGRIKANERIALMVDLPISNADVDGSDWDETLLANPYIGGEFEIGPINPKESFIARVGVRLPLASDDKYVASYVGMWTLYDRFEAFMPDLTTVIMGVGWSKALSDGVAEFEANVNGAYMFPGDGDSELFGDYNIAVWFPVQTLKFGIGASGRIIVSEDDLDLGERTVHHARFAANLNTGSLKPGIQVQIPLEEGLSDIVDYSYGVSLTYLIK